MPIVHHAASQFYVFTSSSIAAFPRPRRAGCCPPKNADTHTAFRSNDAIFDQNNAQIQRNSLHSHQTVCTIQQTGETFNQEGTGIPTCLHKYVVSAIVSNVRNFLRNVCNLKRNAENAHISPDHFKGPLETRLGHSIWSRRGKLGGLSPVWIKASLFAFRTPPRLPPITSPGKRSNKESNLHNQRL